uniref:Uncharacterized protein n=1 Tax=Romanomermis culicivorax TaxID=13658 RepID=A0A915J0J4_ROMCU
MSIMSKSIKNFFKLVDSADLPELSQNEQRDSDPDDIMINDDVKNNLHSLYKLNEVGEVIRRCSACWKTVNAQGQWSASPHPTCTCAHLHEIGKLHYQTKLTVYAVRIQDASRTGPGCTKDAISTLYQQ